VNATTGVAAAIGAGTFAPGSGFTSSASFTTSSLPVGSDTITASYAGNMDFAGATLPTIVETITPSSIAGSFTLTVAPNPVSISAGSVAQLTVTVTPQNGFTQGVNLACANLPFGTSCSFADSTIASGGGATTLTVETTAPQGCGVSATSSSGGIGSAAPFALAGVVLLLVPGKRRWLRVGVVVAAIAAAMQISGCGNCIGSGTRPGTYTFEVIGTAAGSSTTQSQLVTMMATN
jgi:hypothetical protein